MRGGRTYSSRGSGNRGSGSNFRGSNNSYRGNNSSSGRYNSSSSSSYNNRNSGSYSGGGSGGSANRSRFEHRSSSDRFSRKIDDRSYSRNDSRNRGDSPGRKRARHDAGSSRRDFSNSSSDYNHRYENHGRSSRDTSSHRRPSGRQLSPVRNSRSSHDRSKERMGPPSRPPVKKFRATAKESGGASSDRSTRDSALARGSISKTKIAPSTSRSTVVHRRLVLRQRDSARRVKMARLRHYVYKQSIMKAIKKRKTAKEADGASNSKGESNEKAEKKENGDESAASPEKSKASDSQAETAEKAEENGTAEKSTEEAAIEGDEKETTAVESEEKKTTNGGKKSSSDKKSSPRKFIRLTCVHCRTKSVKFQEYTNHLYSRKHKVEMRQVALRQKSQIARMRSSQRKAQRELEETITDIEEKPLQFCMLCRLNYRTPKDEHQESESHVNMKKFLLPYCKICRISFKSPMVYETHRCSLEHIKRKARTDSTGNEHDDAAADDDDDGALPVDLDKFLTVDSVGDVDGIHSHNEDSDENVEHDANAPKAEINVGNEHVKKIEVYYCDLCRFYLPHLEDPEAALQKHCSTRNHLRAYLRFKENQSLKQAAELIHRRDRGEKTPKKDAKPPVDGKSDTTDASSAADKIWTDGDKDVAEENPNESITQEDEDEDSTIASERYDRFKNSEKSDTEMEKEDVDAEDAEVEADDVIDIDKNDSKTAILDEENAVVASEA